MTRRLFSIPKFRFSVGDIESAVGKWWRGATMGKKKKDGSEVVFSAETLSEMVVNAQARGDKIAICQDHKSAYVSITGQPAPSLGYFYALAVFDNGELVCHWAKDEGLAPDGLDEEGEARNGLYCRLGEVTTLGLDPKEGLGCYAALSPMFSDDDQDEQGNDIGYSLIDFGATSTPFQSGCEIQFHKLSTGAPGAFNKGTCMDELKKRFGLGEDSSAEEVMAAMTAHFKKMDDDKAEAEKKMAEEKAEAQKLSDEAEKDLKMADDKADADCMAKDGGEEDNDPDKEADDKKAMCKSLGLPENAPLSSIRVAMSAKLTPMSEVAKLRQELDQIKAERDADRAASVKSQLETFADNAIQSGQWDPSKKAELIAFAKADFKSASNSLLAKGTFTALKKLTAGGDPIDGAHRREREDVSDKGSKRGVILHGEDFAAKAKAYAKANKCSLFEANVAVAKADPESARQYLSGDE